jgi:hypothetical protein
MKMVYVGGHDTGGFNASHPIIPTDFNRAFTFHSSRKRLPFHDTIGVDDDPIVHQAAAGYPAPSFIETVCQLQPARYNLKLNRPFAFAMAQPYESMESLLRGSKIRKRVVQCARGP